MIQGDRSLEGVPASTPVIDWGETKRANEHARNTSRA